MSLREDSGVWQVWSCKELFCHPLFLIKHNAWLMAAGRQFWLSIVLGCIEKCIVTRIRVKVTLPRRKKWSKSLSRTMCQLTLSNHWYWFRGLKQYPFPVVIHHRFKCAQLLFPPLLLGVHSYQPLAFLLHTHAQPFATSLLMKTDYVSFP